MDIVEILLRNALVSAISLGVVLAMARLGLFNGFSSLVAHYRFDAASPPNTRWSTFSVGLLGNSTGSVGSNQQGLYLYGGFLGGGVLIPWTALRPLLKVVPKVILREQRTQAIIVVSQRYLAG
jgi:hypothetical protein